MPKISVIVPVYNVEKYIHRCVDSILSQTFTDFELILVDDGSPDNCGAICDEYAAKDSRVRVIHQKNSGLSAARNAGIDWAFANSDSEWITFIDSDDWVHLEMFELLILAVRESKLRIGMCYLRSTTSDEETDIAIPREVLVEKTEMVYASQYASAVVAPCKLYRKELYEGIRYPAGRIAEDLFTSYNILFKEEFIAVIASPMYYYFQSENSIMRSGWSPQKLDIVEAQETALAFFEANDLVFAKRRQMESYTCCLASQWWLIRKLKDADRYKEVSRVLQKKLRTALKSYVSFVKRPLAKDRWIYEAAFPSLFNIYWMARALFCRIMIGRKHDEYSDCN